MSRAIAIVAIAVSLVSLGISYRKWQHEDQPAPVAFLGDSITWQMHGRVDEVVPGAENRGVSGITTLDLIRDGHFGDARMTVLTIGTNDARASNPMDDWFACRVRVLSAVTPGPVLWNAIPPQRDYDVSPANAIVRSECARRSDCTFLETPFQQPQDYQADGMHLSPTGYAKWTAAMKPKVARILREKDQP